MGCFQTRRGRNMVTAAPETRSPQTPRSTATNWRSKFHSPVSPRLAAHALTLRPADSNRNKTSFKNVCKPMSPNEKTFSNRNSKSQFPHSQPPSVKLAPLAPARVMTAARGRAGLQSLRNVARIFVGRSFSCGGNQVQSARLQPLKYSLCNFHGPVGPLQTRSAAGHHWRARHNP